MGKTEITFPRPVIITEEVLELERRGIVLPRIKIGLLSWGSEDSRVTIEAYVGTTPGGFYKSVLYRSRDLKGREDALKEYEAVKRKLKTGDYTLRVQYLLGKFDLEFILGE